MASVSNDTVVSIFKEVYGQGENLLPEGGKLAKAIPFKEGQKVGEKYVESVVLTAETGFTLCGSGADSVNINAARAGVVKQIEVSPYITTMASKLPFGMVSRSLGDKKAFFNATKYITENNLRSHGRLHEVLRLYGQSPGLLGYVYYGTETYRDVAFTTGTGTLTINGSSVAFTTGVNTSSNWILLGRSFCPLAWVGMKGVGVAQVDSNGDIVGQGSLLAVDPEKGAIKVDFTPVAASSATSHRVCYLGMEDAKEYIGIDKVVGTTSGSLFGVTVTDYDLWMPNQFSCGGNRLTLDRIGKGVAGMVNRAMVEEMDLDLYINPWVWNTIATTEAGLRAYDSSYNKEKAQNGFKVIEYYTQTGVVRIHSHPGVKESEGFCLALPTWSRSGSAEPAFNVPGMAQDLIVPLENETAFRFLSYSDQYVFCNRPSLNLKFTNINFEANS